MVDSINSNMGSTKAINHSITSFGVFLLGIEQRMTNTLEFFFRNKCRTTICRYGIITYRIIPGVLSFSVAA